eukprot:6199419-Pleurochrysis_carterae.AAC.1
MPYTAVVRASHRIAHRNAQGSTPVATRSLRIRLAAVPQQAYGTQFFSKQHAAPAIRAVCLQRCCFSFDIAALQEHEGVQFTALSSEHNIGHRRPHNMQAILVEL